MKRWKKSMVAAGLLSIAVAFPSRASTNLETGSSLAGISVVLNNFFAGTTEPEKELAASYDEIHEKAVAEQAVAATQETAAAQTIEALPEETTALAEAGTSSQGTSSYNNIAVSKIEGSVNIRTEANTTSAITGKIQNDSAATILDTVEGEDGTWYKIQSGNVTGYIKAEYFVTGEAAEARVREVGTTYGTVVGTQSLRLRDTPDLDGKTLTLLAEGAQYTVIGEEGDFLKVAVDTDLEGYVFKEYMQTSVSFKEAISVEEEQAKEADEQKRREEAEEAMKALEEAKEAEKAKQTTKAPETAPETAPPETTPAPTETALAEETTKPTEARIQTIAANPENGAQETVAAPVTTTEAPTTTAAPATTAETVLAQGPGVATTAAASTSTSVTSATRTAIVAYAKQFLGNPYVYGGTSLTDGADCSGFVMSVFAHFGISTGRSSRDQAAKGKEISTSSVQPGDLLFYASGDYINHVGIYVGGGQIIHSSTPATGICYAPSNYRTPCKAVTFLD